MRVDPAAILLVLVPLCAFLVLPARTYEVVTPTLQASFTWFERVPSVIVFDALGTTIGTAGISAYIWDFGDGNTTTTTDSLIVHTYDGTFEGNLSVTLKVSDTSGYSSATTQVIPIHFVGRGLLMFASKSMDGTDDPYESWGAMDDPYGFAGPNELITVYGRAIYNYYPVQGKLVGFQIFDPYNARFADLFSLTDQNGVAVIRFMLSNSALGIWNITGTVQLADIVFSATTQVRLRQAMQPVFNTSFPRPNHNRVLFNASNSVPAWNGTNSVQIVTYRWDFGDGNVTTTATPTVEHEYFFTGKYQDYNVTLKTADLEKSRSASSQTITLESPLGLAGATDKDSYYIREKVRLSGTLSLEGHPATGCLLAVQVNNRRGYPLLFRTIEIGDASLFTARARIDEISLTTEPGLVSTDTAILNNMINLNIVITNLQGSRLTARAAVTLFDGNLIPFFVMSTPFTIDPAFQVTNATIKQSVWIPGWAHCGKALAVVNLYSDVPENWGTDTHQDIYALEAQYTFYLARNLESGHPYSVLPTANASGVGWYEIYFRMPPDMLTLPGSYEAHIVAYEVSSPYPHAKTTAEFSLTDYPTPPNAVFTYLPLQVDENITVTLDGSSSSAEGYNDTITEYEWTIYDPYNPDHIVNTGDFAHPPPANATHAFPHTGTYTVQVNVTDNEGLWSAASKPLVMNSTLAPPNAAFTCLPLKLYESMTVTLDGSASSADNPNDTIIAYEWTIYDPYNPVHIVNAGNFTDPPDPTVTHAFPQAGTYTVQVNVTDNQGLWSATSKPIVVLPEFGPKANFTWTPTPVGCNQTVTLDASQSLAGWSKQTAGYSTITSYTWNFGDATPVQSTGNSTIQHKFMQAGNWSVQLTVTDSVGRPNSIIQIVQVLNRTNPYDLNADGKVDMKDIAIVARAFMTTPNSPNWNPIADINRDGKVDMKDIAPVAKAFGT